MRSAVIGLWAVAFSSGAAWAGPPTERPSSSELMFGGHNVTRGAAGQSFDFEAPAFSIGPLGGQSGWTSNSTTGWVVAGSHPAGGAQHARGQKDVSLSAGAVVGAAGPVAAPFGPGLNTVSLDFSISAPGGADYDIQGQSPSQSLLSWRIKLYYSDLDGDTIPGEILILDDVGFGLQFVSTGIEYTPGAYANLRVQLDSAADTIEYFLNNAQIYSSAAGVFAATSVEQVVLLHDNFQNPMERGDFDNISLIPAPGAAALLGLAALAAARRRRN